MINVARTSLIALCLIGCMTKSLLSGLILDVNLQHAGQTDSQVTFDVVASFQSTDIGGNLILDHFVESITLDLTNSDTSLQAITPQDLYSRFSVINADWEAGLDQSLGSIQLLPLAGNPTDYLYSGNSRSLAKLVVDTSALSPGTYTVSLYNNDPAFVDAFGEFGNGPELLVAQADGVLTASPITFNVSAVPEPSSLLIFGIAGSLCFVRCRKHVDTSNSGLKHSFDLLGKHRSKEKLKHT